ncbi:TlpA family protein disulfide reductase [Bacillus alkalicellulosilyticus]|uniref:TlpA family protein disulfide reductase n=1 Tax=Alkalihalobacterium alkalicellulosilyticum TaxID=1912214 RepID=UPI00099724A9|nr:redoxin domain-containing protein [Bacillus alkalicellulosilyticus]
MRFPKILNIVILFSILSIIIWTVVNNSDRTMINIGDIAPNFKIETLNSDNMFHLEETNGTIRIVNFWASWCSPCVEELPVLQNMQEEYKDQNIKVLLVNLNETEKAINLFLDTNSIDLPIYLDKGEVADMYNVTQYPTSFLISEEGEILGKFVGELTKDYIVEWIEPHL